MRGAIQDPRHPRRVRGMAVIGVAVLAGAAGAGWLIDEGVARAAGPGAAPAAPAAEDEFRVFEADLGPAWIDVSAYPPEEQKSYAVFTQKCSKCHTLARPINSNLRGNEWAGYVSRMSRKPGSGISPKDGETILRFLVFDSNRRERTGALDPELVPFLKVSQELSGVRRFPASKRDIRVEDAALRITAEWDPRSDLTRLFPAADGQKLVKWTRREPHKGEIVVQTAAAAPGKAPAPPAAATGGALGKAVDDAVDPGAAPRERVESILDWLDEEVAKKYRAGDAAADQVLADRHGDATEFTRLFLAMASASGIPARPRVGLVARRTGFFFHVWAEVWLGQWVPVDPYLGQLPADLTHIRVATSGEDALTDWSAHRAPGLDRLQLRVVPPPEPKTAKQGG